MNEDKTKLNAISNEWEGTLTAIGYGFAFSSDSTAGHVKLAIKNIPADWSLDSIKEAITLGLNQKGDLKDMLFGAGLSDSELRDFFREILKELGSSK